jgi:hypothetical protein
VHHYCAIDNRCVQPARYTLCLGDLQATPDAVTLASLAEPVPTPQGGDMADGTYDLIDEYKYGLDITDEYERAALRIFDAGTHAEQIYDATSGSPGYDSPHRFLNVNRVDATTLSFDVTCPDKMYVLFPHYLRGYTAGGDELWLFQSSLIEVYRKRL